LAWPSLDHGSARPGVRDLPIIAALALSASAGYNILFLNGLRLSPATDASMIIPGLAPIVSTVLAAIVLHDRPNRTALVGLAVAASACSSSSIRPARSARIALSATRCSSDAPCCSAPTS
jgi:drug/metabolite transporter (DMT)-like permease